MSMHPPSDAGTEASTRSAWKLVPIFPLPNVVLLPRAVLPLHIFEPRYRQMMRDTLAGPGLIAMALFRGPQWQHDYHGRPAIHDVLCLGRILTHEKLPDGRYNLLLQGIDRVRLRQEDHELPYRRADLERLESTLAFDVDLEAERAQLARVCAMPALAETTLGMNLAKLSGSPMSTADLADVMSYALIEDVETKQALLAEPDVRQRVRRAIREMRQTLGILASPDTAELN